MELTPDKIRLFPIVLLMIIGCFGLLNSKSILRSLLSLDVIDTATITIFVFIAGSSGFQTPIVSAQRYSAYSDPYPQAIILTAIVIGFATQVFSLPFKVKNLKSDLSCQQYIVEKILDSC